MKQLVGSINLQFLNMKSSTGHFSNTLVKDI
jgi:hypothetical protein